MFYNETDIGAVQSAVVAAVCTVNAVRAGKLFAEVTAHKVFVSQLCTYCRPPQGPVCISVKIYTIHICTVVIERIFVGCIAEKFKAIRASIPIERRTEIETTALNLGLQGGKRLESVLELVVPFNAIERI